MNYFLTDHLGSVRVIVDGTGGKVLERNDYYPFEGETGEESDCTLAADRFKYNGKEEQVTGEFGVVGLRGEDVR